MAEPAAARNYFAPFGQVDLTRAQALARLDAQRPSSTAWGFDALIVHPDTMIEDCAAALRRLTRRRISTASSAAK